MIHLTKSCEERKVKMLFEDERKRDGEFCMCKALPVPHVHDGNFARSDATIVKSQRLKKKPARSVKYIIDPLTYKPTLSDKLILHALGVKWSEEEIVAAHERRE
jgi:hypothetical protein